MNAFKFGKDSGLLPAESTEGVANFELSSPTVEVVGANQIKCSVTYDANLLETGASVTFRIYNTTKDSATPRLEKEVAAGEKSLTYTTASNDSTGDSFSCDVKLKSSSLSETQKETKTSTKVTFTPNTAPVVGTPPTQSVKAGQALSYTFTVTDAENNTLTLSCTADGTTTSCPTGVSISSKTLTWTPTTSQVGAHTLTIVVSDGTNQVTTTLPVVVLSNSSSLTGLSLAPSRPTTISEGGIRDVFYDGTNLMVATGAGLAVCNAAGSTCSSWYTTANGLRSNSVHGVFALSGSLYVGTTDGLTMFRADGTLAHALTGYKVSKLFAEGSTINSRRVYAVVTDPLNTWNPRLYASKDDGVTFEHINTGTKEVSDISYDATNNKLYVATEGTTQNDGNGLWSVTFNATSNEFSATQLSSGSVASSSSFTAVAAHNGSVFATGLDAKLYKSSDGGSSFDSGTAVSVNGTSATLVKDLAAYSSGSTTGVSVVFDPVTVGSSAYNIGASTDGAANFTFQSFSEADSILEGVVYGSGRVYTWSSEETALYYSDSATLATHSTVRATVAAPGDIKDITSYRGTIMAVAKEGLYTSTNEGSSFSLYPLLDATDIQAIDYCLEGTTLKAVVGVTDHDEPTGKGLYIATVDSDFAETPTALGGYAVYDVAVYQDEGGSAHTEGTIFVATNNGIWMSSSACGSTYTRITNSESISFRTVYVNASGDVWAGGETGVYRFILSGGTWTRSSALTSGTLASGSSSTLGTVNALMYWGSKVFIGTDASGFFFCQPSNFGNNVTLTLTGCYAYTENEGFALNKVNRLNIIVSNSQETIVVSGDKGLAYYMYGSALTSTFTFSATTSFTKLNYSDGLPSNNLFGVTVGQNKVVVGGAGGSVSIPLTSL